MDTVKYFWSKVEKLPSGCWEWKAWKYPSGYGACYVKRRARRAHRYAYEITHGPIPGGYFVCHKCDNPPCVNPDHLFLGTPLDNMQDRARKGRTYRKVTDAVREQIIALRAAGLTTAEIASRCSLGESTARRALQMAGISRGVRNE